MHMLYRAVILLSLALAGNASAQTVWHFQNKADAPPGVIGQRQLLRGGPLAGYFQPVEVTAPGGSLLSVAAEGTYAETSGEKVLAGMLIGQVYRLKVGNIPGHEGKEVFPTIEVIDRLYPPPGQAARFPIPVTLTQEELEYAIDGRYVLRVIYVEDQQTALPVREIPGHQRYVDIAPNQDALEVADRHGRPVAILRMGSRVPLPDEDEAQFQYQYPPVLLTAPPVVGRTQGLETPLDAPPQLGRPSRNFRRVPESKLR